MNEKLKELISQAKHEEDAANKARVAENNRVENERREKEAAKFKKQVETALGEDVLEAIGPVAYATGYLAMTFTQDGKGFQLEHVTEGLVNFKTANPSKQYGHQFNLKNENARRSFLLCLEEALGGKPS
jgi:hypothetical protein